MPPSIPAAVEPRVLRWARESVQLTQVAASRKLDLPDERVAQWESGEVRPTIAQLKKAASLYRRALAVFFLDEPPADFDTLRDFRRLDAAGSPDWSVALHGEFRRAEEQRQFVLELLEMDDAAPSRAWQLAAEDRDDEEIAARMQARLAEVLGASGPRTGSVYDHLGHWTAALEAAGVLVLATARGRVAVDEMRGLSIYFDDVPVVMVNGADAPRGRLFSLLHEYAHLVLRTSGLCDLTTDASASTASRRIESRCNRIAAAILMPADEVRAHALVLANREDESFWQFANLQEAAVPFGVSAEALLRRLVSLGIVSEGYYRQKREEFLAQYADADVRTGSGGDWYRTTVRDLGKGYVRLVTDAHRRGVVDSYTASVYLNAKVSQIGRLAAAAGAV